VVHELNKIFGRIYKTKLILIEDAFKIEELTNYTMEKLLTDARSHRAKRYIFQPSGIEVNFYTGREKEYLILPNVWYCSCMSQYPSNMMKRRVCYHLLVYMICDALGLIDNYNVEDEYFQLIMQELK
jgi:predicted nucleic acid-binding Zn finger protein